MTQAGDPIQGFTPTHLVGAGGLPTWPAPDPAAATGPRLEPNLEVQVAETNGAWARVVCSNGWSAWVDGRQLVAIGSAPSAAGWLGPPGGASARLLTEPVVVVTATLRGLSLWGVHARLAVFDQADAQIGSGDGLGRRGQIVGKGFALAAEGGGTSLTVVPRRRDWVVTDGSGRTVGTIERGGKGLRRLTKPTYELRAGEHLLGRVSTEELLPRKWAVTDAFERPVGAISDATRHGRMNRNGSCRLEMTAPVDRELRQLILVATANEAIGRMQYYNRPRRWA